jgi:hypothetical protein
MRFQLFRKKQIKMKPTLPQVRYTVGSKIVYYPRLFDGQIDRRVVFRIEFEVHNLVCRVFHRPRPAFIQGLRNFENI